MHKKSFIILLSTMLAVMVASVTLVFTVGPLVSADDEEITVYYGEGYERIGQLIDSCSSEFWNHQRVNVIIADGVREIVGGEVAWTYSGGIFSEWRYNWAGNQCGINDYSYKVVTIQLPESLEIIGQCSLRGMSVKEIVIPDGVTSIGSGAFNHCEMLEKVHFGSGIKIIDHEAFIYCNLKSIVIPKTVTSLGRRVFGCCENLTTIYCECSEEYANTHWDSDWKEECNAKVVWNYGVSVENEKQNNTTTIAIAGGVGGTVGLGTIGTIIGVVVHKKRKLK